MPKLHEPLKDVEKGVANDTERNTSSRGVGGPAQQSERQYTEDRWQVAARVRMNAEKNYGRPNHCDPWRARRSRKKDPEKESSKDEFLVERRQHRQIRDDGKLPGEWYH